MRVLGMLRRLVDSELARKVDKLKRLKQTTTRSHFRKMASWHERRAEELTILSEVLTNERQVLADHLLAEAEEYTPKDGEWMWKTGDPVPKWPKASAGNDHELPAAELSIPDEYICPIGKSIMEDPVIASDGFTYERAAIQRSIEIRPYSPHTGLELSSTSLRHNGQLGNEIREWTEGKDICVRALPEKKREGFGQDAKDQIEVHFLTDRSVLHRKIPISLRMRDLYTLVFRGLKCQHSEFDLYHDNTVITMAEDLVSSSGIGDHSEIQVTIREDPSPTANSLAAKKELAKTQYEELVLIKLYIWSHQHSAISYWIPRYGKKKLVSVAFRYMVDMFDSRTPIRPDDLEIWGYMFKIGDGQLRGHPQNLHRDMSEFFVTDGATGILDDEPLVRSDWKDRRIDGDDETTAIESQPLVLKLWAQRKQKVVGQNKALTRVCSLSAPA